MPNDLVSREAVMAAVKKCFIVWERLRTHPMEHDVLKSIANLPAAGDERWEKLRAFVKQLNATYSINDDPFGLLDSVIDEMDRLSPPQQEAGDNG